MGPLMALQRLCCPGSDLAGSEWVKTVEAPELDGLALQHFHRTAAFLAGVREELESKLFTRKNVFFAFPSDQAAEDPKPNGKSQ